MYKIGALPCSHSEKQTLKLYVLTIFPLAKVHDSEMG